MLFSYLIGTVFKLYGPVTDYWTHSINSHISYEYVITNSDECHIALGITRIDSERAISWNSFPVVDELGEEVIVMGSKESTRSSGVFPSHTSFWLGDLRPGNATKLAYLLQPRNSRFSFTINLKIESDTAEISTESTSVTCDVDKCKCREVR
jgi:hypothetical protein